MKSLQIFAGLVVMLLLPVSWQPVLAHGGVVEEADVCVIKISYLKAHFKIYQPRTNGHTCSRIAVSVRQVSPNS
jgi:hypothetical protein